MAALKDSPSTVAALPPGTRPQRSDVIKPNATAVLTSAPGSRESGFSQVGWRPNGQQYTPKSAFEVLWGHSPARLLTVQ